METDEEQLTLQVQISHKLIFDSFSIVLGTD